MLSFLTKYISIKVFLLRINKFKYLQTLLKTSNLLNFMILPPNLFFIFLVRRLLLLVQCWLVHVFCTHLLNICLWIRFSFISYKILLCVLSNISSQRLKLRFFNFMLLRICILIALESDLGMASRICFIRFKIAKLFLTPSLSRQKYSICFTFC